MPAPNHIDGFLKTSDFAVLNNGSLKPFYGGLPGLSVPVLPGKKIRLKSIRLALDRGRDSGIPSCCTGRRRTESIASSKLRGGPHSQQPSVALRED